MCSDEIERGVSTMLYASSGATAQEFVWSAYQHACVLRLRLAKWTGSAEARSLRHDDAMLPAATHATSMRRGSTLGYMLDIARMESG